LFSLSWQRSNAAMPFTGKSFNPSILTFLSHRVSNLMWRRASMAAACGMVALSVCGAGSMASAQTKTATPTTLAVTAGGSAATTVASGSVVTLTASVGAALLR
jgi:hypothetical protein